MLGHRSSHKPLISLGYISDGIWRTAYDIVNIDYIATLKNVSCWYCYAFSKVNYSSAITAIWRSAVRNSLRRCVTGYTALSARYHWNIFTGCEVTYAAAQCKANLHLFSSTISRLYTHPPLWEGLARQLHKVVASQSSRRQVRRKESSKEVARRNALVILEGQGRFHRAGHSRDLQAPFLQIWRVRLKQGCFPQPSQQFP